MTWTRSRVNNSLAGRDASKPCVDLTSGKVREKSHGARAVDRYTTRTSVVRLGSSVQRRSKFEGSSPDLAVGLEG